MSNTSRHIAAALAWLFGLPLLAVVLFSSGALPAGSQFHSTVVSLVWGVGLVAIFASWALRDAPAHGRSRSAALAFTAAWFVVFVFAVFPYLFFTRGLKNGIVAALTFASLCLAFAVAWLGFGVMLGKVL